MVAIMPMVIQQPSGFCSNGMILKFIPKIPAIGVPV